MSDKLKLAQAMAAKLAAYKAAYADALLAEANRSVVHHQMRNSLRAGYAGEKVTEARIEDEAKASPQMVAAITQHIEKLTACGNAEAAYALSKAEYDIAMSPA